ncbi:nuclear transport factor 2 family protein [Aestuariibius sp. 2305UL40-4]|uniref:nuclear transport factor 2 family protein n=1 Tax=Aestuariibius violaceus TaxID=3234132 RepID=UPI00345EDF15
MKAFLKSAAFAGALAISGPAFAQELPSTEDQLAIQALIAGMNRAVDNVDNDAYLDFYADEFVFDPGFGEQYTSRDGIRTFLEENQASGFIVGKRHVATNLMMEQQGDRIVSTYYLTVLEREQAPAVVSTALITDEFADVGDEWKVVRHVTSVDPGIFTTMEQ